MEKQARENKKKQRGKEGKKKRPLLVAVFILLGVCFAIVAGLAIKFVVDINNPQTLFEQPTPAPTQKPTPTPTQRPAESAAPLPTPTPSPTPHPEDVLLPLADLDFMRNRVNVLVLGIDESAERSSWGSFRTDTMILVTIDFDTNDVAMISVPRDSYVKIYDLEGMPADPEEPMAKINNAFSKGGGAQRKGFEYAMYNVQQLFGGVPINYYVGVNMTVVKQLVDAMGGVYYDVDIEVHMNGRYTAPGYQHLTGQQVLDYCRVRKIDSDIKRIDRQQRMLTAILSQLKSTGQIANIPEIYRALEQNIATNLSFKQISSLALMALNMDMEQLERHTVAGKGMTVNNSSCWCIDVEKLEELVDDVFGATVTIDPALDYELIAQQQEMVRQYCLMYGPNPLYWPMQPDFYYELPKDIQFITPAPDPFNPQYPVDPQYPLATPDPFGGGIWLP